MAYVVIEDFRGGLDTRRIPLAAPSGSLAKCLNAHIDGGGQIERRKAFVEKFTLPAGKTIGLSAVGGELYVFGSEAGVSVPSGVIYKQLPHPNGDASTILTLPYARPFGGKFYTLSKWSDGRAFQHYDGSLVWPWAMVSGRNYLDARAEMAAAVAAAINQRGQYSASVATVGNASIVTVEGLDYASFSYDLYALDADGNLVDISSDISAATVQSAVEASGETVAQGEFTIVAGDDGVGTSEKWIDDVKVGGVSAIAAKVVWAGSQSATAQAVAAAISQKGDYDASSEGATVYIRTKPGANGVSQNGATVEVTATKLSVCTGGILVASTASGSISSLTIEGQAQTSGAVALVDNEITSAGNIASAVNSYTPASKDYIAARSGAMVYVAPKKVTGTYPSGVATHQPSITASGTQTLTVSPSKTTVKNLENAAGAATGTKQRVQFSFKFSGVWPASKSIYLSLGGVEYFTNILSGAEDASAALGFKEKMNIGTGRTWVMSGIGSPAEFFSDALGFAAVDLKDDESGDFRINGFGTYEDRLAIFARRNVKVYSVDVDPSKNVLVQSLANIGARAPRSILSYGGTDVFFLADSGVRSLRARDGRAVVGVMDLGTPVDALVRSAVSAVGEVAAAAAVAEIEPEGDRMLLAIGSTVFVFTYYQQSRISAWSSYAAPGVVSDFAVVGGRLYLRSGDTVYLYGGDDGGTYSDTERAVIETSFFDGRKIASFKSWYGFDISAQGHWAVYLNTSSKVTRWEYIGEFNNSTMEEMAVPMVGDSPVAQLRFESRGVNAGKIAAIAAHYDDR